MVAGWYSDSSKDILASATDQATFSEILTQLNWAVDPSEDQYASVSVYQGLCYGIDWDPQGPAPESKPETAAIAVGNTSIDAMTVYIDHQADGDESIEPGLLEAFQYNLLPLMDQPNGPDLLFQNIHTAWFGKQKGGYAFVISKSPDQSGQPGAIPATYLDHTDPNLVPDWLYTLNQDQANYDQAFRELRALQWNLYRMWWTKGKFDNLGEAKRDRLKSQDAAFSDLTFEQALDPNVRDSPAWLVQQQAQQLADLATKIPHGTTKEALEQSVTDYAQSHDIAAGYVLQRTAKAPFYQANDPTLLISGAKAHAPLVIDEALQCRFEDQLISGINFQNMSIAGGEGIPSVDLSNIPVSLGGLIREFFFLDPNDAYMIPVGDAAEQEQLNEQMAAHEGLIGTLPALDLNPWQQPWSPMCLLWTVEYYPIPHDDAGTDNWTFNGYRYVLNEQDQDEEQPEPILLSGTTLLTPKTGFNFKKKLDEYRQKHPDLDEEALTNLEAFISDTDSWDLLSQTLDGFTMQLASRYNSLNVVPTGNDPIAAMIGKNYTPVPLLGAVPEPFTGWPRSDFQAYRSGQFCFRELMLVDRFGQSLQLTTSQTYLELKPVVCADMQPTQTVLPEEPYRFIQVPPRLLQPARLNFDFVAATDDSQLINLNSGVNPVCAWILPNHLDRAIACYDPAGSYLGELTVVTNEQDQQVVVWEPAIGAAYPTVEAIGTTFPHLGQMLSSLVAKGPEAFNNFYQVIDETLWVVDPLGARDDQNLSVLVGRPLALTRCRLQYELDGPAHTDPTWQYTFQTAEVEFVNYHFPVRLGELKLRNDGLIGYFEGTNYDQFNCVHLPEGLVSLSPPYNVPIKEGNFIDLTFQHNSDAYVTMLMDPRASVHATTSILPAQLLELPRNFVDPALGNMAINIKVGPVLAAMTTQTNDQQVATETLLIPQPAENNGTWSWQELSGTTWNGFPIQSPVQTVTLSNVNPELRTGVLQFTQQEGNE